MVGMGKAGLTTLALALGFPPSPDTGSSPQRKEGVGGPPPSFVP